MLASLLATNEQEVDPFDQDLDLGKLFDDSDQDVLNELTDLNQIIDQVTPHVFSSECSLRFNNAV